MIDSRRALLVLSACLLLAACGDDDDGGTLDGGGLDGGTPDAGSDDAGSADAGAAGDLEADFCTPLATLICTRADTCGCDVFLPGGALDREGCVERIAAQCVRSWGPLTTGGALVDADAAAACVALIGSTTPECETPGDALLLAHCEPFVVHPAAIGEACTSPFCAGGEGTCVEGECVARGEVEAECGSPFSCATGLVCSEGACIDPGEASATCGNDIECAPPLRCLEGTCRALGAASASCSDTAQCGALLVCEEGACAERATETCSESDACGNLSRCGAPRQCAPRGTAGATCQETRDCDPAHFCGAGTCALRAGAGETCSDGIHCAPGLGCDVEGDGTCRALPAAGSACLYGETGPVLCGDGLACIDGTCGPLPTEGENCAIGNVCAPGLGCDFSPEGSICIVPRGEGGSCESDRSCAAELHCLVDTCVPDLAAGEPCSAGNECAGICAPSASGAFTCRDAPDEGDACLFDEDCGDTRACVPDFGASRCLPEICELL